MHETTLVQVALWGPMEFFLSFSDGKALYFQPNTDVCRGEIWLDWGNETFIIIISKEVFTFTFAMGEFKTAVTGCFRRIFHRINAKIAFPLELHNYRKQSCFIAFFPFCVLWKEEEGRMGRFQTSAWCFCQIFYV